MNDKGRSVGYIDLAGGLTEAVSWSPSGNATDLFERVGSDWTDTRAVGINKVGDIVGYGHFTDATHNGIYGFLLTPVAAPELSTWAMLLLGFAGLGFAGYRGARKREAWVEGSEGFL